MNTIHGAFCLASLNKSRTRDGPTPTNISIKSDPDIVKKGTLASPATAFANKVLPVPLLFQVKAKIIKKSFNLFILHENTSNYLRRTT